MTVLTGIFINLYKCQCWFIKILFQIWRTKTFEDGDHKICFDNSFSIFSAKTVFFEISTDNDDDDDDNGEIKIEKKNDVWGDTDQAFYAGLRPEEIYDIHVQDIKVNDIFLFFYICQLIILF